MSVSAARSIQKSRYERSPTCYNSRMTQEEIRLTAALPRGPRESSTWR